MKDRFFFILGYTLLFAFCVSNESRIIPRVFFVLLFGTLILKLSENIELKAITAFLMMINMFYILNGFIDIMFIYLLVGINALFAKRWISFYQETLIKQNKFVLIFTIAVSVESIGVLFFILQVYYFQQVSNANLIITIMLCVLYTRFQKSVTHVNNLKF